MEIKIKRRDYENGPGHCQAGVLHINGRYYCDTEENAQDALPAGKYRIVRHYSKHYERQMPLVLSQNQLPDCDQCLPLMEANLNSIMPCHCPMLKPGNGVHKRTDGSILLGTHINAACLVHPLHAFNPLAERIRKATRRGTEITLIIQ